MERDLHRVPEGSQPDEAEAGPGDEAHLEETAAVAVGALDGANDALLAGPQVGEIRAAGLAGPQAGAFREFDFCGVHSC